LRSWDHTPLPTLSHRPVQAVCLDSSLAGHSVNPLLTVLRPNPEIKESGIVVALTAKKGQSRPSFRFRGRSFMAFVLAPELPLHDWMAELDSQLHRSERFFLRRPVILDLSRVALTRSDLGDFISDLRARDVQIIGVEGVDPSCLGPGLPPLLEGGRPADNAMETVPAHRESAASNVRQEQSCLPTGQSSAAGTVGVFPQRRRDGHWLCCVRRRGHRGWLHSYLWLTSGPSHGRFHWQRAGAHLLPQDRSRTSSD